MIGLFVWMNLLAVIAHILIFFDVMLEPLISEFKIIILYLPVGTGVWIIYRFRHKEALEKYARIGKSAARTSLIWIYIVLSIAIGVRTALSAYNHDKEKFDKERILVSGEITDINIRRRTGRSTHGYFFRYKFIVDGKKYSGLIDHSKIKEQVIPGDSIAIFYYKSDPEISGVGLKENGDLGIKRKY
jgi:hypothetical protein